MTQDVITKEQALLFSAIARQWIEILERKQQPLGKDFEKVLSDNFWDLCVVDKEEDQCQ